MWGDWATANAEWEEGVHYDDFVYFLFLFFVQDDYIQWMVGGGILLPCYLSLLCVLVVGM